MKLHIGCGKDKRKGYINLDISDKVDADIVCNIEDGIPFKDDSCSEVIANNVLTQISTPRKFIQVMNDLWRIVRNDGVLRIRVPNAKDICAWQDTLDVRRFTDQSFTYMEYGHRRYEQYGKHYGYMPWKVSMTSNNGRQMEFNLIPIK